MGQSTISVGDRVRYRVGKGYSEARVSNIAEGTATLASKNGKLLYRLLRELQKIEEVKPSEQATPQTPS